MIYLILPLIALLTGFLSSLGVGGGMILMVYLTTFMGISQIDAQGINLLFFIPISALALIFHAKNGLLEWKKVIPSLITGIFGAVLGVFSAEFLPPHALRKIFALFILIIGLRELFSKRQK